jgi:hypothetical protein
VRASSPTPYDSAAATIPPTALRLPRRLPEPDTATPSPPAGLEPALEADDDLPEAEVELVEEVDPMLELAGQPLEHLDYDERRDLRLRRLVQLSERRTRAAESADKRQLQILELLQGWQGAVLDRAADNHADRALARRQRETCLGWLELARQLITHPKALQGMATVTLAIATAMGVYDYLSPLLLPWLP